MHLHIPWIKTKWKVLFDIIRLDRVKPWSIDLVLLLRSFQEEVLDKGMIDFFSTGTLILSSSVIHRMKTEKILEADKPLYPKDEVKLEIPALLRLPLKPNILLTTLVDVLNAIKDIFAKKRLIKDNDNHEELNLPAFDAKVDEFFLNLEEKLQELIIEISSITNGNESVSLKRLISGRDKLQAARTFILILFLASKGYIDIEQDEESYDITLKLSGDKIGQ